MKNIIRLFRYDLRHLCSNVMTVIIVLGLVLLPSLFSWYNVLACWDVFENTDNLKVAVSNTDEGYQSDLVPLEINLGDQIQTALLEDKEMQWVFTSQEDAIQGAESGKYYAAVVIPPSFSKDMMTFYSQDVEHASILYYTNEKKNVVAPKLTDRGADDVANKINSIFIEKISEVGLNVASALVDYSEQRGTSSQLAQLAERISDTDVRMKQASEVMSSYASLLSTSQVLVSSSAELLGETSSAANQVISSVQGSKESVDSLSGTMIFSTEALHVALDTSAAGYADVAESIDEAFTSADAAANDSSDALDNQAESIRKQAVALRNLADVLATCQVPADFQGSLDVFISQLRVSADTQERLADNLEVSAESIRSQNNVAQDNHTEAKNLAEQAQASLSDLSQDYATTIKPQFDTLQNQLQDSSGILFENASLLTTSAQDMQGTSDSVIDSLDTARSCLESSAQALRESSEYLAQLSNALNDAISSGDWSELKTLLQADPRELAQALAAPVQLERTALYPAANFGSQMAPLYTMLGLWIGSLLLAITIKVNLSKRAHEELGYLKLHQVFWGRFATFALLSFLQSSILALGNMLFLQVQVAEPLLYMLCYWLAGLVFSFIVYTLVVSFANLGKALAVFLLIVQVSAGGGSYPLPMLPDFVQSISPFLPLTHAINALRSAMMGLYQMDFWIELTMLLAFIIPFLLLGLVFRKPLIRLLEWYVAKTEESKLLNS